ncbi:hypothetical protein [Helicobacter sp. T3_23-1056]
MQKQIHQNLKQGKIYSKKPAFIARLTCVMACALFVFLAPTCTHLQKLAPICLEKIQKILQKAKILSFCLMPANIFMFFEKSIEM